MKRLGLALLLLVAAVLVAPEPAPVAGGTLAGFARSLGGLRVAVVDAVFLQAEAARRAGRRDDATDLYELVLQLDPDDEAAAAYVAEARFDVVLQVPDVASRHAALLALLDEIEATWGRRTHKARLQEVAARLILTTRFAAPPVFESLRSRWPHPERIALRWLVAAARETGRLPEAPLELLHLRELPYLVIEVAATAQAQGDLAARDQALADGHEILALRQPLLAQLVDVPWDGTLDQTEGRLRMDEVLQRGLTCVEQIAAGAAGAQAAIDELGALTGPSRALEALEAALASER
ncbi:MAG: hypothetical protein R3F05_01020 [Planctomycetota bacterium]|nr:hypothetical protein [Planctomycetota bacterium]MCB9824690.1 hypothetical protein [Planctomycetota bacterium]MCB9899898.1 hypothetical protein [Planctomycetota bacterium]